MNQRLVYSALLAGALATGLMAWLAPTAQGSGMRAPATIRSVAPPPTGVDSGNCTITPCATIGYAISQSAPGSGDRINVESGVYTEHITMTNGVSVHGTGWPTTIINGNFSANQPTVYFPPGIDSTTVLSGVQVTKGGTAPPSTSSNGSGIRMDSASPQIINTWLFYNNGENGGGAYVNGGSPTFINVPAWFNWASWGGGFYLTNANVTMTDPYQIGTSGTISFNVAYNGGGGVAASGVTLTLSGLRINGNQAVGMGAVFLPQDSIRSSFDTTTFRQTPEQTMGAALRSTLPPTSRSPTIQS